MLVLLMPFRINPHAIGLSPTIPWLSQAVIEKLPGFYIVRRWDLDFVADGVHPKGTIWAPLGGI